MTKDQVLEKLKFDVELRGLSKNTQAGKLRFFRIILTSPLLN